MSSHIGIGFSKDPDIIKAAQQAAMEIKTKLGENPIGFVLFLTTVHYPSEQTLPIIQNILNPPKIIGSSTAGIILSKTVETQGIAILAISSDEIHFGVSSTNKITNENILQEGKQLALDSLSDLGPHSRQTFLCFIDGNIQDNSLFLKGLQETFGNLFPIIGAGSSDDFQFMNTFQIFQKKILTSAATGVIFGGQTSLGIGGGHGWRPLGKPRRVTESQGNIIKKINNKKAALLYEEYFEDEAKHFYSQKLNQTTILYPLGVFNPGSNSYLLRNAVDILEDGSIVCQGNVPKNSEVHIMLGNKDACKQAAIQAAKEAKKNFSGKKIKLILIFESMTRLKLLGRTAKQEIFQIKEIFEENIPIFGMYSYGEIYPFETSGKIKRPHLQNESIIVIAIG
ncbi:hypothetical protein MNBD_UNCLBAC01-1675 [hydrothermal vent metagenome]|uniref:FIST domain-containing protein n=1 Tax=hydrothermal vent metagenome TaxID=652676 RepID=A0A3B1DG58_9ZZZZ